MAIRPSQNTFRYAYHISAANVLLDLAVLCCCCQDIVRIHQIGLVKLIGKGACIYVCGDAKNMAKDVMEAITNAIQTVKDVDEQEAKKCVLQLQKEKRYLQDIWT